MKPHRPIILWMLGIAVLAGCSGSEPARPKAPPPTVVDEPPPPPPTVPKAPEMVRKKAEMGVGDKGRGYGQGSWPRPWPLTSPRESESLSTSKSRGPKALQGHRGSSAENARRVHGEDHPGQQHPSADAAAGHRYVYDPKQQQLMVEQPAGN